MSLAAAFSMNYNPFGLQFASQLLSVRNDGYAESLTITVKYVRYVGGHYHCTISQSSAKHH